MPTSGGFDDDGDIGFAPDKDLIKATKKPYEVDYKVFGPANIQAQQDEQIEEVAAILGQTPEAAAILLRHMRWNKERLVENYMEKAEEMLEAAGLEADSVHKAVAWKIPGFACDICCEDDVDLETYALKCGHRYCVDCYTQYLEAKIKDEGEAARIQCPTRGCNRVVDSKSLHFLVSNRLKDRCVFSLADDDPG